MGVDASKLRRRRSLGLPPTEGASGMEEAPQIEKSLTGWAAPAIERFVEVRDQPAERMLEPSQPAVSISAPVPEVASKGPDGARKRDRATEPKMEVAPEAVPVIRAAATASRGRGEEAAARRLRAPRPEEEPRVPFTTRVTLSTKERLEDACYHLRRRHQEFINEAIVAHLKKHGF